MLLLQPKEFLPNAKNNNQQIKHFEWFFWGASLKSLLKKATMKIKPIFIHYPQRSTFAFPIIWQFGKQRKRQNLYFENMNVDKKNVHAKAVCLARRREMDEKSIGRNGNEHAEKDTCEKKKQPTQHKKNDHKIITIIIKRCTCDVSMSIHSGLYTYIFHSAI